LLQKTICWGGGRGGDIRLPVRGGEGPDAP
jgi:hypothetical protein